MADTRQTCLVEELVERCATLLPSDNWDQVHRALSEMHDQLRDDIPDEEVLSRFRRRPIGRLGNQPASGLAQTQVYANSASPDHRAWAGAWIRKHYRKRAPA